MTSNRGRLVLPTERTLPSPLDVIIESPIARFFIALYPVQVRIGVSPTRHFLVP